MLIGYLFGWCELEIVWLGSCSREEKRETIYLPTRQDHEIPNAVDSVIEV